MSLLADLLYASDVAMVLPADCPRPSTRALTDPMATGERSIAVRLIFQRPPGISVAWDASASTQRPAHKATAWSSSRNLRTPQMLPLAASLAIAGRADRSLGTVFSGCS